MLGRRVVIKVEEVGYDEEVCVHKRPRAFWWPALQQQSLEHEIQPRQFHPQESMGAIQVRTNLFNSLSFALN